MPFNYTNQTGVALMPDQIDLLATLDNVTSPLPGIKNLHYLHSAGRVEVALVDSEYIRGYLKGCLNDSIKARCRPIEAEDEQTRHLPFDYVEFAMGAASKSIQRAKDGTLLGLYSHKVCWFDPDRKPTVFLIRDNIERYASKHDIDVSLVFGFVYVHEMMHAYYDSLNSQGYPSFSKLEETFAECGMLYFLKETEKSSHLKELTSAAEDNVRSKQNRYHLQDYAFGLSLYEQSMAENMLPRHIERYREISNWIFRYPIEQILFSYEEKIAHLYPENAHDVKLSMECYETVKKILYGEWTEPEVKVKKTGINVPFHIDITRIDEDMWALHTNTDTAVDLAPIFASFKLGELTASVLKVLKTFYFENYLTYRDRVNFVDFNNGSMDLKLVFYATTRYSPKMEKLFDVIPEPLQIDGKDLYPYYGKHATTDKTWAERLLDMLYEIIPLNVAIVKGYGCFTLWGDETAVSIFEPVIGKYSPVYILPTRPRKRSVGQRHFNVTRYGNYIYQTVGSRRKNIGNDVPLNKIPLVILKDLCNQDWQRWYYQSREEVIDRLNSFEFNNGIRQERWGGLVICYSDYMEYREELERYNGTSVSRFFDKPEEIIDISDIESWRYRGGTKFVVSKELKDDEFFERFCKVIIQFGYELEEN